MRRVNKKMMLEVLTRCPFFHYINGSKSFGRSDDLCRPTVGTKQRKGAPRQSHPIHTGVKARCTMHSCMAALCFFAEFLMTSGRLHVQSKKHERKCTSHTLKLWDEWTKFGTHLIHLQGQALLCTRHCFLVLGSVQSFWSLSGLKLGGGVSKSTVWDTLGNMKRMSKDS